MRALGLRKLPDYIIIGAQRCGTSTLDRRLNHHPRAAPASRQEVHFFDQNFHRGLDWYATFFPSRLEAARVRLRGGGAMVAGEASAYYLFHPLVPKRVALTMPDVRLIVLLRNPVDRAFNHWLKEAHKGVETLPFEEAIEVEPERLAGEEEKIRADPRYRSFAHQRFSYLARGDYLPQFERWHAHFPREQLLILRTEDLMADDPTGVVAAARAHLGLDPPPREPEYPRLPTSQPRLLNPNTRKRLIKRFEPLNRRLYAYLGRDFGWA